MQLVTVDPRSQWLLVGGTDISVWHVLAGRSVEPELIGWETAPVQNGRSRRVVFWSKRLVATSWLPADVEALHEVHSDPETMRYVRNGLPESRDQVRGLVAQYIAEDAAQGWTKWRLASVNGSLVGRAGFGGSPSERQLSYLIRRELWGQGLATEVATSLVTWHLAHAPGIPLRATVQRGNDASIRVLDKVGFEETGPVDYDGIACRGFTYPLG